MKENPDFQLALFKPIFTVFKWCSSAGKKKFKQIQNKCYSINYLLTNLLNATQMYIMITFKGKKRRETKRWI